MPPRRILPAHFRMGNSLKSSSPMVLENSGASSGPKSSSATGAEEDHERLKDPFDSDKVFDTELNGQYHFTRRNSSIQNREKSNSDDSVTSKDHGSLNVLKQHELIAIANNRPTIVKIKLGGNSFMDNDQKMNDSAIRISESIESTCEQVEETSASLRPKRKRNNLYSSLSPAFIRATAEERAKAYISRPPTPQLASHKTSSKPHVLNAELKLDSKTQDTMMQTETVKNPNGENRDQCVSDDGHDSFCHVCFGEGRVACCDGCPHIFHPSCLPPGNSKISLDNDDDPWYCPECVQKGMLGSSIVQEQKKQRKDKTLKLDKAKEETISATTLRYSKRKNFSYSQPSENIHVTEDSLNCDIIRAHRISSKRKRHEHTDELVPSGTVGLNDENGQGSNAEGLHIESNISRHRGKEKIKGSKGGGPKRGGRRQVSSERNLVHSQRDMNKLESSQLKKCIKAEAYTDKLGQSLSNSTANSNLCLTEIESSGFQPPHKKIDIDCEAGPHLLAGIEKPKSSIPAFFFFIMNNRNTIEKSLHKKSRSFRTMPKGLHRNLKVAEESAALWSELTENERRSWVEVSMKDFEQRVIAWKEKQAIEAMMNEKVHEQVQGNETAKELEVRDTSKCSNINNKMHGAFREVKSKLTHGKSNNGILLELLNDIRFQPLPMVNTRRAEEDLAVKDNDWIIQQFLVQGPVETSVGDNCLGCTRGWNHFCSILKRPIPNSENRAKLQPPVSSLSATRIGLALNVHLPYENRYSKGTKNDTETKLGETDALIRCCPNYQPVTSTAITNPSLHHDDVVFFIEDAMTSVKLESNTSPTKSTISSEKRYESTRPLTSKQRKKQLSCKMKNDIGCDVYKIEPAMNAKIRRHNCGVRGDTTRDSKKCIPCRRSMLLVETANRPGHTEGFVKPLSVMLGRVSVSENNPYDNRTVHENYFKIGTHLEKMEWTPNVILPPEPKRLPKAKLHTIMLDNFVARRYNSSCDEASSSYAPTTRSFISELPGATSCSMIESKSSKDIAVKHYDMKRTRRKHGENEEILDRHQLAIKHKESANDLIRRCLSIAMCGILTGMIRRDPLRLFQKPVPKTMVEYYKVIKDPIDFQTMRRKILANEYTTLGSFIYDAKRLCINACIFNAADSLYAKTANQIYESLLVMQKRANQWITILKNAHASSFIANDDAETSTAIGIFKHVESIWPDAVALLDNGSWLREEIESNFIRMRENELAYYGALAIRRTVTAARESLASSHEMCGMYHPVVRRSHVEDEQLRNKIDKSVSLINGPLQLKNHEDWKEQQLLKILKRVQKFRIEARISSKSGCARCDDLRNVDEVNEALSLMRRKFKRKTDTTKPRVAPSRSSQTSGLGSHKMRKKAADDLINAESSLEPIGQVANENLVKVSGSRIHGWGLFADQPFKKDDIVAEYIGEYISNAVADTRERYYRRQRIQDYQFRVDGTLVIDATMKGGYARYINHSCNPNCITKIVKGNAPTEHLKRVLIIAQRDIAEREELSYDYHFPLEMNLEMRIPCACGSKVCRGFMNWDIPEKVSLKGRVDKINRTGSDRNEGRLKLTKWDSCY